MPTKPDVLLLGGGVIGCASAYYLTRQGATVTVVDKGELGHGSSYGNAGWIVPSHITPLPAPGILGQVAKWILDADSPLYLKPRLDAEMLRWVAGFASCANERHLRRSAPHLAALQNLSLELLQRFVAEHGRQRVSFEERGLLHVCNTQQALETVVAEADLAATFGVVGKALDATGVRQMEPAVTGPVVGGVHYESDCHVEPLSVVEEMARLSAERGARLCPQTEVFAFETKGDSVTAVHTTRGRLTAGRFVLAAGSWTPPLARQLGLRVPLQAGKGYSLIVEPFEPTPRMPTMLAEKKIAITPRTDSVRICGTMELAGLDESLTTRRVFALARGARQYLNVPAPVRPLEVWRGLRPCTPDGLPIIGRAPKWQNLLLAAGHATIGLSTATGTGRLVAELCLGRDPTIEITPFAATRF